MIRWRVPQQLFFLVMISTQKAIFSILPHSKLPLKLDLPPKKKFVGRGFVFGGGFSVFVDGFYTTDMFIGRQPLGVGGEWVVIILSSMARSDPLNFVWKKDFSFSFPREKSAPLPPRMPRSWLSYVIVVIVLVVFIYAKQWMSMECVCVNVFIGVSWCVSVRACMRDWISVWLCGCVYVCISV